MNHFGDPSKLQDRLPSEERFRLLFEDAPVAYHEIDNKGRITRVNRAECAMLGYDPLELVGMPVWDLTSPQDRAQFRDSVEHKLAGASKVEPFQGRFFRKDGGPLTIEFYENAIEDESGRIAGIRGILINITEREQAMEVILASESKFRELFDNVMDGVFQSTAEGRILTANPALLKMLGYDSEAEFLQVDVEKTLCVDPERRAARIAQLERDGELRNYELQLRTRDGRQITVLENSRSVRDGAGAVSYYEGTLTDITGRVQAQEALTAERDFTSAVIDSAGSLIVVLRPDGLIIRFNRACEQTSGYSFEEVHGQPFWDVLIIPDEIEPLKEIFQKLRQGADSIRHENHWWTRTGELRLIAWSNVVLRDKQGAAAYVISTGIDITDRRHAEEALRISEQRYRDLFENAHDVVYTHDLRGAFTSVNAAAERITGYTRGEALQMNMSEIVAPKGLDTLRQMVDSKLGGEGAATYELDIIAKGGRRVSLEVSARLQLEDGNPIGIHGVARDITDRKLAEAKLESYAGELARKNEELAHALAAAKEATELKSRFLATMSHEIRTPINGVLGMTELLMSTRLDAEQRDYAQAVRHSAEALLVVINDILDISKMEAGKLNLERLPFDPYAVVGEVIGLLAPRAAAKGLRLTCESQEGLPRVVRGDPGRLRQILLNLIGNAVKFTEEGEVAVSTLIASSSADAVTVQFCVRDTGIGISPEKRSRLFQSFVQGDSSTTRKYGGTGLGLAISKQLVEMMGGVIEFESELGRGSTFTFLVAFEKYSPEDNRAPAGGSRALSLAGCKALVVDERPCGVMTREYLETLGCRADLSGRPEALDLLRRAMAEGDPYRFALLDLSSPEPEIFSLSMAIGADPATAETIRICCVEPPLREEDRLKSFGFSAALQKPVTPWMLQDTLIAALEGTTASRKSG